MTWGHWYWPAALLTVSIVASGLFFPAEIYAVLISPNNTLTAFSRYELGLQTAFGAYTKLHTIAWWWSFLTWDIFVVAITAHIWFLELG
jgi:hypothetical protein